ncbi:hypothetical protein SprV_0100189800 [Sparganum proliferum]
MEGVLVPHVIAGSIDNVLLFLQTCAGYRPPDQHRLRLADSEKGDLDAFPLERLDCALVRRRDRQDVLVTKAVYDAED